MLGTWVSEFEGEIRLQKKKNNLWKLLMNKEGNLFLSLY